MPFWNRGRQQLLVVLLQGSREQGHARLARLRQLSVFDIVKRVTLADRVMLLKVQILASLIRIIML